MLVDIVPFLSVDPFCIYFQFIALKLDFCAEKYRNLFIYIVLGETGLGKSTLINSLFLTEVYDKDKHPGPSLRVKKTVGVETSVVLLKENGVNLTLTIVDTPGFGDAVDNSNW